MTFCRKKAKINLPNNSKTYKPISPFNFHEDFAQTFLKFPISSGCIEEVFSPQQIEKLTYTIAPLLRNAKVNYKEFFIYLVKLWY